MTKKILIFLLILVATIFISTHVFAENNMQNAGQAIGNVVGGVENTLENAARGTAGAVNTTMNNAGAVTRNAVNDTANAGNNAGTTVGTTTNQGYAAARTNANIDNDIVGRTNSVVWITLAITALAIVGVIWYYFSRRENSYIDNDK